MLETALHWSDDTFQAEEGECIVLVDTLRASSVIPVALSAGADRVLTVAREDRARGLKQRYRDAILAGERSGDVIEGFDCGNSPPYMLEHADGRTVVLTTGNFCRVIGDVAEHDVPVIAASAVNAGATADYIAEQGFAGVHLVATGTYHFRGEELDEPMRTQEDSIAARRIAYELDQQVETDGEAIGDMEDVVSDDARLQAFLEETEYAGYLRERDQELGQETNQRDMAVCFDINAYPAVPVLERGEVDGFVAADGYA